MPNSWLSPGFLRVCHRPGTDMGARTGTVPLGVKFQEKMELLCGVLSIGIFKWAKRWVLKMEGKKCSVYCPMPWTCLYSLHREA